jgi:hypothetical protein
MFDEAIFQGVSDRGEKLLTQVNPVTRLRMSGAKLRLTLYAFMVLTGTNLRLFPPNSHTAVDIKHNECVEILFLHVCQNYSCLSTHQYIKYKAKEKSSDEERENDSKNQSTCDWTKLTDAKICDSFFFQNFKITVYKEPKCCSCHERPTHGH